MDVILQSHIIDPAAIRNDNFENFFTERMKTMLEIISSAMGKPPAIDVSQGIIPDLSEEIDDDVTNDD